MKKSFLTLALLCSACANVPSDGSSPSTNPVGQPFSWTVFCAIDVPLAVMGVEIYYSTRTISAADRTRVTLLETELQGSCSQVPNNTADAQSRASQTLASLNATVKNPNQSAPSGVVYMPLKARPQE